MSFTQRPSHKRESANIFSEEEGGTHPNCFLNWSTADGYTYVLLAASLPARNSFNMAGWYSRHSR